jgi:hypothetical protein
MFKFFKRVFLYNFRAVAKHFLKRLVPLQRIHSCLGRMARDAQTLKITVLVFPPITEFYDVIDVKIWFQHLVAHVAFPFALVRYLNSVGGGILSFLLLGRQLNSIRKIRVVPFDKLHVRPLFDKIIVEAQSDSLIVLTLLQKPEYIAT